MYNTSMPEVKFNYQIEVKKPLRISHLKEMIYNLASNLVAQATNLKNDIQQAYSDTIALNLTTEKIQITATAEEIKNLLELYLEICQEYTEETAE